MQPNSAILKLDHDTDGQVTRHNAVAPLRRWEPRTPRLVVTLTKALMAVTVAVAMLSGTASAQGAPDDAHDADAVLTAQTDPSALTAVRPCRLVDTRPEFGTLQPRDSMIVNVSGRCGIPSDAVAITGTLTAVGSGAGGHLAVTATSYSAAPNEPVRLQLSEPTTSNLNFRKGAQANGFTSAIGRNGAIRIFTSASADVMIDVTGYFAPTPNGARAGRFVADGPVRVLDTRESTPIGPTPTVLDLSGLEFDASAYALTVVAVENRAAGHVRIWPADQEMPNASVVNFTQPYEARASSVIVGHSTDRIALYSPTAVDVVIDITGHFTSPAAPASTDGLFVATMPARLLDTRTTGRPLSMRGTVRVSTEPHAAGVFNVAQVDTTAPNYLTAWPGGYRRPVTSVVNAIPGNYAAANTVMIGTTERGIDVYARRQSHVIVDQFGYFLGKPLAKQRRMFLVTDSALAGLRWTGNLERLTNADWRTYLESCRRLVYPSCRGREGYAPITAAEEIEGFPSDIGPDDVLVMGVGYNDWEGRFEKDFTTIMELARAKGFKHVVWLTYRADNSYQLHNAPQDVANYRAMNAILAKQHDGGNWPELSIWDYDGFSADHPSWFTRDGIHLTTTGAPHVADWFSAQAARFDG